MGPLVSIGVAVYNVREYLCACLGSVCKQASEEIEILLVDDGSSDGSGEVCDAYAGAKPICPRHPFSGKPGHLRSAQYHSPGSCGPVGVLCRWRRRTAGLVFGGRTVFARAPL